MSDNKQKTVKFDKDHIDDLPQNKPVVYKITNDDGENIYTGVSKRGNVAERIKDHLPNGQDPVPDGRKVTIIQKPSIDDARETESKIIKQVKPKHNKQGK